jgi:hypothetical protein
MWLDLPFAQVFLSALAITMSWQDVTWSSLYSDVFVCIGHHDVLARWDLIFPLLRCQGVRNKTYTQLSLSQTFIQNPKNYNLRDDQRFCCHSWCDSMVIFWLNKHQQQLCYPQLESILDNDLCRHLLPTPFLLKINWLIAIRVQGLSAPLHLGLKRNRSFVPQSSFMGAWLPY